MILLTVLSNLVKNCTYLSNRAQNDMIHAMAVVVKNEVVQGICETKLYSIMMDETTDVTGKEQVCVVVRFVDASDVIQERQLAFKPVAKTDAETLFSFLKESLESQKLEMRNIVGQCFDGASNMESEHNGVQAKVKHVAPTAMYMYVHCYAHCLNLVLVSAMTRNTSARNYFGTLEALYCFVHNINYRNHLFHYFKHCNTQTNLSNLKKIKMMTPTDLLP